MQILHGLRKTVGDTLFKKILKSTFFGHFVAGETRQEVLPIADKMAKFGVKSILDYSSESDLTQEEAETAAVEGIVGEEVAPEVRSFFSSLLFIQLLAGDFHAKHRRPKDPRGDPSALLRAQGVRRSASGRRVRPNVSPASCSCPHFSSTCRYFYSGERECDKNADIFCWSI